MDIAIIGMAGRFPGAVSPGELWRNLASGAQGYVATPSTDSPDRMHIDTRFCDIRLFEPELFAMSDGESQMMDPQHRILLECAHEALEDAGYDSWSCPFPIGVYAGSGFNHYFMHVVGPALTHRLAEGDDPVLALLANEKDFLASRISYKLGLRGPSVTVQTACSTSLVAVHLACQSLRVFEADLCLAGGVSINCGPDRSHVYREGGILSRDGRCRPFDADATGTTFADGAGIIVLKRLDEAVRDRDDIYAVIRGTTINNDGAAKVGYTAPSVEQYSALVQEAQAVAGIDAESIGFLEGHGTGTRLGDAVEIRALSEAFHKTTAKQAFCALGSVKSQVGHLDIAAGVTGLMKTALSLRHRLIPPTLHFETPNPALAQSPFFVNARPLPWAETAGPRRAAVSSLGIGGTNVHAILEEAPSTASMPHTRGPHLLVLSARSNATLHRVAANLLTYLQHNPAESLARVAFTLQMGRRHHVHRLAVVATDTRDAVTRLEGLLATGSLSGAHVLGRDDDGVVCEAARAYVEGKAVDWAELWDEAQSPGRVHLPTYPFQRRSCWFQPRTAKGTTVAAGPVAENAPHLYMPHWTRVPDPPSALKIPQGHWVFIGRAPGLGMESARALETLGLKVWRGVTGGDAPAPGGRLATLNPSDEPQLKAFLQWITSSVGRPERIVFDPALTPAGPETGREEPALLQVSRLARVLCETWPGQPLHLVVLTERGSELTVQIGDLPSPAPVMAAALTGAAEYPALRLRCLDVAAPATVFGGMPQPRQRFLNELLRQESGDLTAFAGGYVWEKGYAAAERIHPRPLLKPDGVYVITGGLGGVGLELAKYLAGKGRARLALVTRRPFQWQAAAPVDGEDVDIRRRLARVEESGARVRVFSADVASLEDMRRVVEEVEERWGPVNGVFHAAGLAGGALMHNASREELARVSAPKGGGAQVLARLFASRELDFLFLFSSTAAVFPAVGQLHYCAANMFLDVLAPVLRRDYGIAAYSVNWPHWSGVGMAARVDTLPFVDMGSAPARFDRVSRAEVKSVLDEWAAGGWPAHVVVTTMRPESTSERRHAVPIDVEVPARARSADEMVATIKEIWLDLLGDPDIAEDADFFDRGGDSIMAVQLIGRFRKAFHLDYSFDRFFAAPTIREMVAFARDAESQSKQPELTDT
ncbi:MAG: SDR family NAD(P)-dependent oxidoreductase [Vicinamibacterales bacterium]